MNNYHLYEEIGHGKFSMVYKGRKRHTIRYVAVKSIEKSRREKVMVEVSVLSQLDHPNVVGFVAWHETRNHLWVIFEYCAGGDIMRLLRMDGRLPEDTVRRFGRDIAAGLLHVHARGVIYSDLKPGNVLFTEHGVLKLSDFGHAQRLDDICRMVQDKAVLPRRGTPHYMAPELFLDGGMHSVASDLWAFGCVLHELIVGRPPFHSSSFAQLQQMVLEEPVSPMGSGSTELQAIVASLLWKSPLDRADWTDIRARELWQGRPPGDIGDAEKLPVQPHLDELRRVWHRGRSDDVALKGGSPSPKSAAGFSLPVAASPAPAQGAVGAAMAAARRGVAVPAVANTECRARGLELRRSYTREADERYPYMEPLLDAHSGLDLQAPQQHDCAVGGAFEQGGSSGSSCLRSRLGAPAFGKVRDVVIAVSMDIGVRPISRNPQIETVEQLEEVRAELLPFVPLHLEEICSFNHADLETFLAEVYRCVAQGSPEQKVEALLYLEQICCHMQVADVVVNSSLMRLILRMLHAREKRGGGGLANGPAQAAAPPGLRMRLLSLIGQLLRHATYLEPVIAEYGLVDVLLDALAKNNEVALRRRSIAALGELVFYVATQAGEHAGVNESRPLDSGHGESCWQAPVEAYRALVSVIQASGEDEVLQHYASKTLENVATQVPTIADEWFFSHELLVALAGHVRRSTWETFRLSCLAALAHLVRGRPECLIASSAWLGPDLLSVGFGPLAPHGVTHSLHLLGAWLLFAPSFDSLRVALPEQLIDLLTSLLAQPRHSPGLRGRACVLIVMLAAVDDPGQCRFIRTAIDRSFVPHIDRLGREKDPFVVRCVAAAAVAIDMVAVCILQSVMEGCRMLAAMSSTSDLVASNDLASALVQILPVFLHLLSSVALCGCVFEARALPLLGASCEITARSSLPAGVYGHSQAGASSLSQLQPLILMILDSLASQQGLVLEHAPQLVRCILPALASCLPSRNADTRMLALKAFAAICVVLLNDSHVFDPTIETPSEISVLLEALLCSRALPALLTLLGDEAPSPSYALKLMAALLSRGSAAATAAVHEVGLAPALLSALRSQQPLTLHVALLVHCLLRTRAVRVRELRDACVLDAVHATFRDAADVVNSGSQAPLDLAMLDAALCIAEEVFSQIMSSLQLQQQRPPQELQQHNVLVLTDMGPLSQLLPVLTTLCLELAHSKMAPLLDKASASCQLLLDAGRFCGAQVARRFMLEFSPRDVSSLLDALVSIGQWTQTDQGGAATAAAAGIAQRRLLMVLGRCVTLGVSVETRAELAAGLEELLRSGSFGDDPATVTEARTLISAVVSRGYARGPGY